MIWNRTTSDSYYMHYADVCVCCYNVTCSSRYLIPMCVKFCGRNVNKNVILTIELGSQESVAHMWQDLTLASCLNQSQKMHTHDNVPISKTNNELHSKVIKCMLFGWFFVFVPVSGTTFVTFIVIYVTLGMRKRLHSAQSI